MCFCHFGRNRQNRGQKWWLAKGHRKPDHHVVTTRINRPVTVVQYHLLRKTVVENNRHNENHGSLQIKHLFLVSWKIILQNQASWLLRESWFTRKKLAIPHFTGKKRADHESAFTTLFSMLLLITIIIIAMAFGHDHVIASWISTTTATRCASCSRDCLQNCAEWAGHSSESHRMVCILRKCPDQTLLFNNKIKNHKTCPCLWINNVHICTWHLRIIGWGLV